MKMNLCVQVNVRLSAEQAEAICAYGDGSVTVGVRRLADELIRQANHDKECEA
jgi:hypothetical protein